VIRNSAQNATQCEKLPLPNIAGQFKISHREIGLKMPKNTKVPNDSFATEGLSTK